MKYMGSKSRLSKHIAPILNNIINRFEITCFVEPFLGGNNISKHISFNKKIGNDNNIYLIALYKHIRDGGYIPEFIFKDEYNKVRNDYNHNYGEYPDYYIGLVGFLSSYNGRFFDGGYSGKRIVGTGKERNYYKESVKSILSDKDSLLNMKLVSCDYRELEIPHGSLVYCDPPYKGTKQYNTSKNFDHNVFWEWCREISKHSIVIVSELDAPEDFKCIWEQEIKRTIDNNKRTKSVEKLFIQEGVTI